MHAKVDQRKHAKRRSIENVCVLACMCVCVCVCVCKGGAKLRGLSVGLSHFGEVCIRAGNQRCQRRPLLGLGGVRPNLPYTRVCVHLCVSSDVSDAFSLTNSSKAGREAMLVLLVEAMFVLLEQSKLKRV
jgi:hypothetical protein